MLLLRLRLRGGGKTKTRSSTARKRNKKARWAWMAKQLEGGPGTSSGPMWLDRDGLPRMLRLSRKATGGKAPRKQTKQGKAPRKQKMTAAERAEAQAEFQRQWDKVAADRVAKNYVEGKKRGWW